MSIRPESLTRDSICGRVDHGLSGLTTSAGMLNVGRVDHVYQVTEPHQGY